MPNQNLCPTVPTDDSSWTGRVNEIMFGGPEGEPGTLAEDLRFWHVGRL